MALIWKISGSLLLLILFSMGTGIADGTEDDPKSRAIMEKVDDRDDGNDRVADMEMVLIDKICGRKKTGSGFDSRDYPGR